MSAQVHNVESPWAPAPRQRRDGSHSNGWWVCGSANTLVGKRVDNFLLVSLLTCGTGRSVGKQCPACGWSHNGCSKYLLEVSTCLCGPQVRAFTKLLYRSLSSEGGQQEDIKEWAGNYSSHSLWKTIKWVRNHVNCWPKENAGPDNVPSSSGLFWLFGVSLFLYPPHSLPYISEREEATQLEYNARLLYHSNVKKKCLWDSLSSSNACLSFLTHCWKLIMVD